MTDGKGSDAKPAGRVNRLRRGLVFAAFVLPLLAGAMMLGLKGRGDMPVTVIQQAQAMPARSTLGMGLAGLSDWSTEQPFIDLIKTARSWTGHVRGQWGGWEHAQLHEGGYLDENGWPKSIPPELEAVELLILTAQPVEAVSLRGRYRLSYTGKGEIALRYNAKNVQFAPGEIWFNYEPDGEGLVGVAITRTDPADPIRDISVVREDHIARFDAGEVFNPDWLALIDGVSLVRFMDWMATNNSTLEHWADRPQPDDYTYTWRGAPAEIMIDLANRLKADPWFTIPHLADEEFNRNFARLVHERLEPARRAHVEYSNEVWNWQFMQAQWAHAEGQARWGESVEDAWVQFYGMRAAQMARIWREEYGDAAANQLKLVLATHTGWTGLEASILDAPKWVAEDPENNRPPVEYFDAYGVTGYFDGTLGRDDTPPVVLDWLSKSRADAEMSGRAEGLGGAALETYVAEHRFDSAVELAEKQLLDGSVTGRVEGSLKELKEVLFPYHAKVAQDRGLELIMYEGGTHVVGIGEWAEHEALTEFFMHLNYTDAMGRLYQELLQLWTDTGGGAFTAYYDIGRPGKWGSWGGLRHIDDRNPRWSALMAFRDARNAAP